MYLWHGTCSCCARELGKPLLSALHQQPQTGSKLVEVLGGSSVCEHQLTNYELATIHISSAGLCPSLFIILAFYFQSLS